MSYLHYNDIPKNPTFMKVAELCMTQVKDDDSDKKYHCKKLIDLMYCSANEKSQFCDIIDNKITKWNFRYHFIGAMKDYRPGGNSKYSRDYIMSRKQMDKTLNELTVASEILLGHKLRDI